MILMMKAKRCKSGIAAILTFCFSVSYGQVSTVENSLFWEVTGNGIPHSSYLFGSHHLLSSQFVDSLPNVNQKFYSATTFVNEVRLDSTDVYKIAAASIMTDSSLDQLLPPEWYHETELWLQEISDYSSLSVFNKMSPVVIQVLILNLLQEQVFGQVDTPMDIYFERRASADGKRLIGLETIDEQLNAFFHGQTYQRQAEMLIEFVKGKSAAVDELIRFNRLYRNQNLAALQESGLQKYTSEEIDRMLFNRNRKWMEALPSILQEQSSFVVVGALHLTGEDGLVNQLRKLGFTVTPISIY
jgi:uncharacterized protein